MIKGKTRSRENVNGDFLTDPRQTFIETDRPLFRWAGFRRSTACGKVDLPDVDDSHARLQAELATRRK